MGFLRYAPKADLIAEYAAKRNWFGFTTEPMTGPEFQQMYDWCWDNFRIPELHIIDHFDARVPEGCVHTTYTCRSRLLPGVNTMLAHSATFYMEDELDALWFKMWWAASG